MKQLGVTLKSLELISNMMTRVATRVRMSGNDAHTDGHNTTLPALPLDDPESLEMLNGYLDHEDGHVAETDMSVKCSDRKVHVLRNVIEDSRIEKIRGDEYVGVRQNLVRLADLAVKRELLTPASETEDVMTLIQKYINYELQAEVLGYESVYPLAEKTRAVCERVMPKGMRIRLDAMISEASSCRSTAEVTELSWRILQMVEEESKEEPPPQDSESGQDQGDGKGSSSGSGSSGDDPGQAGSGGGNGPGRNDGASDVTEAGGSAGDSDAVRKKRFREALQSDAEPKQEGIAEAVMEHLEKVEEQAKDESSPVMTLPVPIPYTGNSGTCDEAVYSVDAVSIGLRQRLSGLLLAKTRSMRLFSTSGSIVPTRLWRVKYGESKVFQRKVEGLKLDTVVGILLDGSGSMSGVKIEMARQAALALSLTLDSINVTNSIGIFSGSAPQVGVVKTFDERAYDIANRLPAVMASGGTPMYSSLLWAVQGLMQRREPRKIVMLISDGQPCSPLQCKKLIDMMIAGGVEVIGIGINASMGSLVSKSSEISDISDLPTAMFDLLEESMMRQAA